MKGFNNSNFPCVVLVALVSVWVLALTQPLHAREVEYRGSEETVYVTPGEPTQLRFGSKIRGGFKPTLSALALERRDNDLIVFPSEGISDRGEVIIVRLDDSRSYSIRVMNAESPEQRDDIVRFEDSRELYREDEEELAPHQEKRYPYAPANTVTAFLREMVLVAEFGKQNIPGYRVSTRYQGETVLSDGTLLATVDRIFIGPNLWGYVLDAQNLLDQTQQINHASFRLDGTRAVSMKNSELSPRPLNIEQQIAGKHKTKVYIVARPKRFR